MLLLRARGGGSGCDSAVEQVAPAADPVAPAADPVAPAAASVAPEPASIVAEPATPIGPTTTGVEGNLPEEFSGLSTQTSAAPVLTDYTPQEFIDIAREALVSPGPNAVDPNPKTRAMDAVFDGLLSDSRPVDRTVAP